MTWTFTDGLLGDQPQLARQLMSALGPDLPTWALQQVGSSPGYTGREALLLADRRNLTKAPTDAGPA